MEKDIKQKFKEQEIKLEAIYESTEKIRKYFKLIFWVTIIAFVLPVIGLMFVVPLFIKTYLGIFSGI